MNEMFRKIAFIGNSGVGKTTTIQKLVESKRSIEGSMKRAVVDEMKDPNYTPGSGESNRSSSSTSKRITIGAAFIAILRDHAIYNGPFISGIKEVRYHIWDTAGQERYHSLVPMFIRGSYAIIVMYDITILQSWDDLKNVWIPFVKNNVGIINDMGLANESSIITIVGTRLDKGGDRVVQRSEAEKWCEERCFLYCEVDNIFENNADEILDIIFKKGINLQKIRKDEWETEIVRDLVQDNNAGCLNKPSCHKN